jgi:hypothetical protein
MLAHFLSDSNQIYNTQVIYGQYLGQFFSNLNFSSRVILRPLNVSIGFMIFCHFLSSFIPLYLQCILSSKGVQILLDPASSLQDIHILHRGSAQIPTGHLFSNE